MFHKDGSIHVDLSSLRATVKGFFQSATSVWKRPGMKMIQVEARMATYYAYVAALAYRPCC